MRIYKQTNSANYSFDFTISGARYRGTTGTGDRGLAQIEANRIYKESYLELKLGKKKEITLGQALAKYWTEHASTQKWAPSVDGYMRAMEKIIGNNILMSGITNSVISKFVQELKARPLSGATINKHLGCLRKVYNLCKTVWGYKVDEVSFGLHRQKESDHRVRYLTKAEIGILLSQASTHLKPIIRFALYTGIRRGNILGLKWKDVDLVGRRIILKVKSDKPGGKHHAVDMSPNCFDMLKSMKPKATSEYVFPDKDGTKMTSVKTSFRTACGLKKNAKGEYTKPIQIYDFRFHDLRHTHASYLVQNDTPIEVVKEMLGHKNISTTLKYAHHDKKRRIVALNKTFKGIGNL